MRVYLGQTHSRALIARLNALGWGECTARGEWPPRRWPCFYDNGAFVDWRRGRPFDEARFRADIARIRASEAKPDFLVLPDRVAAGRDSLAESLRWIPELRGIAPLYLAVQDGMTEADNAPLVRDLDGVFVGGTLPWKLRTGAAWAAFAREHGLGCHIGRCGTAARVRWARRIGATSIDSSLPLFSEENLQRFMTAVLDDGRQMEMW